MYHDELLYEDSSHQIYIPPPVIRPILTTGLASMDCCVEEDVLVMVDIKSAASECEFPKWKASDSLRERRKYWSKENELPVYYLLSYCANFQISSWLVTVRYSNLLHKLITSFCLILSLWSSHCILQTRFLIITSSSFRLVHCTILFANKHKIIRKLKEQRVQPSAKVKNLPHMPVPW